MKKNAWDDIRDLIGSCIELLPRQTIKHFGDFYYNSTNVQFGYETQRDKKDIFVSAVFSLETAPTKETLDTFLYAEQERSYFLSEDTMYEDPALWGRKFPAFTFEWKKEPKGQTGLGAISMLRIDFSHNDFITYRGEALQVTQYEGNKKYFSKLPKTIAGLESILGRPIPHTINFEETARTILRQSRLEEFASACRKALCH